MLKFGCIHRDKGNKDPNTSAKVSESIIRFVLVSVSLNCHCVIVAENTASGCCFR